MTRALPATSLPAHRWNPGLPGYVEPAMTRIRMYSTTWCGYCVRAKALLEKRGLDYEEIVMDDDPSFRQKMLEMTGRWTVPQIFIDDEPIGGYTELWCLDRDGKLEDLAA
jgi:glutaredoxin 3